MRSTSSILRAVLLSVLGTAPAIAPAAAQRPQLSANVRQYVAIDTR